ncbi:unnamed protein product [Microthlaspi erraticum]|uniref:Uncharacterized protein n=1 Tax=Microthlaspi erraticum TaxID=1685480 RepID=A0A6D2LLQ9_9BRAS|nr:unnamed protein product [Microthlaspi erraticum]
MDFIKTSSLRALTPKPRIAAGRETFASARNPSVRLGQSSTAPADHASRPGKHVPRSAKPRHSRHAAHDHAARAGNKPRGRATSRVPRPMRRPSREARPASGRESSANLIRPTQRPTDESVRPRPFRLATTRCPADRPDRPSNAAVDPKPVSHIFKPGLTLSRL